jgi:hypothetical protein
MILRGTEQESISPHVTTRSAFVQNCGFQTEQSPQIRGWTLRPISSSWLAYRQPGRAEKNKSYKLGRGSASFDRFLSVVY